MNTEEQWLALYAETHKNKINKALHLVCVPVIMFAVLGLLSCLRLAALPIWDCNGASLFILAALVFYLQLGMRPFFIMLLSAALMYLAIRTLDHTALPILQLYIGLFVIGWIGQFIGHFIEGKKPSFFQDLQFLLIGPLWIFSAILPSEKL